MVKHFILALIIHFILVRLFLFSYLGNLTPFFFC